MAGRKATFGIILFGTLLIITSFLQLVTLSDLEHYKWLFQQLPQRSIMLRYFFSMLARILGLIAGLGIIYRKDFSRKIALFLSIAVICTVYWKHPLVAVERHSQPIIDAVFEVVGEQRLITPHLKKLIAPISMIGLYAIDISFSVALIYYFTRPRVKELFR